MDIAGRIDKTIPVGSVIVLLAVLISTLLIVKTVFGILTVGILDGIFNLLHRQRISAGDSKLREQRLVKRGVLVVLYLELVVFITVESVILGLCMNTYRLDTCLLGMTEHEYAPRSSDILAVLGIDDSNDSRLSRLLIDLNERAESSVEITFFGRFKRVTLLVAKHVHAAFLLHIVFGTVIVCIDRHVKVIFRHSEPNAEYDNAHEQRRYQALLGFEYGSATAADGRRAVLIFLHHAYFLLTSTTMPTPNTATGGRTVSSTVKRLASAVVRLSILVETNVLLSSPTGTNSLPMALIALSITSVLP